VLLMLTWSNEICSAFPVPAVSLRTLPSERILLKPHDELQSPFRRSSPNASRRRSPASFSLGAAKQSETEYIDDCFGLIFLAGSFVANDTVFSATFVALSAVALVATRANQIVLEVSKDRQRRLVPAVVAAAALLLTPLIAILVQPVFAQELDDEARLIELGVCAVSVAYGFLSKVDDE